MYHPGIAALQVPIVSGLVSDGLVTFAGHGEASLGMINVAFHGNESNARIRGKAEVTLRTFLGSSTDMKDPMNQADRKWLQAAINRLALNQNTTARTPKGKCCFCANEIRPGDAYKQSGSLTAHAICVKAAGRELAGGKARAADPALPATGVIQTPVR